jgi:uncharacterized Zn finger protein
VIRIDGKAATCPRCGSVAVKVAPRGVPNTVLRCDGCGHSAPRQRFVPSPFDDRRHRAPVIGNRVMPILFDE